MAKLRFCNRPQIFKDTYRMVLLQLLVTIKVFSLTANFLDSYLQKGNPLAASL